MDHTRHMDLFLFPSFFRIVLVGNGGIGAVTALTLSKMGVPDLVLFDDDEVAEINLATQLFRFSDVGNKKPVAVADMITEFSDTRVDFRTERVGLETDLSGDLVISAVDSIQARKDIWIAVLNSKIKPAWYLDTRMAAEQYQHFAVDMNDPLAIVNYDAKLMGLNESDVTEVVCTAKATFFCAMAAAGCIGSFVKKVLTNSVQSHRLVYYLPQNQIDTFYL